MILGPGVQIPLFPDKGGFVETKAPFFRKRAPQTGKKKNGGGGGGGGGEGLWVKTWEKGNGIMGLTPFRKFYGGKATKVWEFEGKKGGKELLKKKISLTKARGCLRNLRNPPQVVGEPRGKGEFIRKKQRRRGEKDIKTGKA